MTNLTLPSPSPSLVWQQLFCTDEIEPLRGVIQARSAPWSKPAGPYEPCERALQAQPSHSMINFISKRFRESAQRERESEREIHRRPKLCPLSLLLLLLLKVAKEGPSRFARSLCPSPLSHGRRSSLSGRTRAVGPQPFMHSPGAGRERQGRAEQ